MPWWVWLLDSVALLALLVIAAVGWVMARRRWIVRTGGAFDMSVKTSEAPGAPGWTIGVAVYRDLDVAWYRTFSLSLRPKYTFHRGEVVIEGRRRPTGAESHALHDDHVVSRCAGDSPVVQVAMTDASLTALLAWLESSPPGRGVSRVV